MDSTSQGEDVDVSMERQRVLSGGADDDVMRSENLTKVCLCDEQIYLFKKSASKVHCVE